MVSKTRISAQKSLLGSTTRPVTPHCCCVVFRADGLKQALRPGQPLPLENPEMSAIMYLVCMVEFGKLAGDVWDTAFSANAGTCSSETMAVLDAKIKHWMESRLPEIPLLPSRISPTQRHRRQQLLVDTVCRPMYQGDYKLMMLCYSA